MCGGELPGLAPGVLAQPDWAGPVLGSWCLRDPSGKDDGLAKTGNSWRLSYWTNQETFIHQKTEGGKDDGCCCKKEALIFDLK